MKKSLLFGSILLLAAGSASAAANYYPASAEMLGDNISVSRNGRYAVIADTEQYLSYLWDSENPTVYTPVTDNEYDRIQVMAVSDDCTMVGQIYQTGGKWRPFVKKGLDGELVLLACDPYVLYETEASAISSDNKYIAGFQMVKGDADVEGSPIKGAYYPCQWTLNENGEYDMKLFFDFDTLGQQGFITYCQSNDGRIIAGLIHAGCSDAYLPAMILDGEFVMWDTVVYENEPWYYKGEIMGYDDVSYINGFKDDRSDYTFVGAIHGVDDLGNLYGSRTTVSDVQEDGSGILHNHAAIYNIYTKEWYYDDSVGAYSCGYNRELMFANGAKMIKNGDISGAKDSLGVDAAQSWTAVMSMSLDTKTLGGLYQIMNPASGEYQYYPFVITLDEELVDVSGIELVGDNNEIAIILSAGRIDFSGAEGIVYDLNGRIMGQGSTVNVVPGTYVAKAGNASRTVIVK